MTNNVGIIVQVRTGSTRLPNKVLLPFYNGSSILDIIMDKLLFFQNKYKIVLATSSNDSDSIFIDLAKRYNVEYFAGDENDVLNRFIGAASKNHIDSIVRICSDNPFLNIPSIERMIDIFNFKNNNIDYVSYVNNKGVPAIKTHLGLYAELVSLKALKKVRSLTNSAYYQEHVTNFIYSNIKMFDVCLEKMPDLLVDREDLRFTIDDIEDFNNLKGLYSYYSKNNYDLKLMIDYVDNNKFLSQKMKNNIKKYNK